MSETTAENIVRICAQSEIAPDTVKAFDVGDKRLAVFNIAGRYYITDDECTHASASLADGMLDGEVIEPPCAMALRTYKVVLEGGDVLVDLNRDAAGEMA